MSQTAAMPHKNILAVILVIDDDLVIRKTICSTLKKMGYQTIEADNGQEGIEIYDQYKPDMILLDVMMPVMDGYESCRQLRQRLNDDFLPIIMLTGLNDVTSIDQAFESGATDFITKPLNLALLGQRVKYGLRSRALTLELQEKQAQLRSAQRIARLGYLEIELHNWAIHIGAECATLFDISPLRPEIKLDELVNRIHPDDQLNFVKIIEESLSQHKPHTFDYRIRLANGSERVLQHRGELDRHGDSRAATMMCTIIDITDRRQAEEIIKYQTYYDTLTDIPNRISFGIKLSQALSHCDTDNTPFGLFFIGIDRFKHLNDALGHNTGDLLLKEIVSRLRPLERDGHLISRFGGNIFALIINDLATIESARTMADELLQIIAQPAQIIQQTVHPSASIGIVLAPLQGCDKDELIRGADAAMHRAKELGGNTTYLFNSEMNNRNRLRATLESDLRRSLQNNELVLYYQPQVNTYSKKIIGMEALLRWFHPQRGLVSPVEFIPVAEEIGAWVLQQACHQTRRWHDLGHNRLRVGVNLSPRQFRHDKLLQEIEDSLRQSGLPPHCLDLEVTEGMAMNDINTTISTLHQLREMGIHTSIDDFGTGHSSLSYLSTMPLNTLKIDRAFVKEINEQGQNGEIAKVIIAMAHCLDMTVIAEGVETHAQFEYLKQEQCNEIQGYLFSPPVAADKFETLLNATF